jgi:hypothetical protein
MGFQNTASDRPSLETVSKKKNHFFANGEMFFLDLLSHRRAGGRHSIIPFPGQIQKPKKTPIFSVSYRNYETLISGSLAFLKLDLI